MRDTFSRSGTSSQSGSVGPSRTALRLFHTKILMRCQGFEAEPETKRDPRPTVPAAGPKLRPSDWMD